jgi:YHS domain-containing protein
MVDWSRRSVVAAALTVPFALVGRARAADMSPRSSAPRVALQGYDPVAYFTDGRPVKGLPEFAASFDDATYWFASDAHRKQFVADPDRYAPQFGGFCAITVSRGAKMEADPLAWIISDGRLYVFSGPAGVPMFRQEAAAITQKGAEQWSQLRKAP